MSGGFPLGLEVCNGNDAGTNTAASLGTSLTSGSANAYGAFTQLIASTPYDTEWMVVTVIGGQNAFANEGAFEIAVGASGSEKVIIHDLIVQCDKANSASAAFPISIPAGTRLSAAVQSSHAADSGFLINVQLFDGSFSHMEGVAGVDSIGFTSAATQGTSVTASGTANTKGSYSQLIASTTKDYLGFFFALGCLNTTPPAGQYLLDIAQGGSGSEQVIVPNFMISSEVAALVTPPMSPFFPDSIPAGTRLAARCQCSVASQTLDLTLYGLYL